ncbi:aspartate kinase [Spongiimicrobium salis]|uniref:aspartate kinase n=1 Tax=Spongiimicrobium salis TaxID=1667022 RepID=UPI00374DD7D4
MKILKFGGSSVGKSVGLFRIENIIKSCEGKKIVVCSAISGVTDILVDLVENVKNDHRELIPGLIEILRIQHCNLIEDLMFDQKMKKTLSEFVDVSLGNILELSESELSLNEECEIITYGELLLTTIYSCYLTSIGIKNILLDAKDFMFVETLDNPNISLIAGKLENILEKKEACDLFITQGFIRIDRNGGVRHLERGGSDYTATLIGAALRAEEIQIWSDTDGMQNNDPRYVENTYSIPHLSYDEAAKLAYFGAKILHEKTIFPAKDLNIPIYLKNTYNSSGKGTVIDHKLINNGIKAIAAKDNLMILYTVSQYIDENLKMDIISVFKQHNVPVYFYYEKKHQIGVIINQNIEIALLRRELEKIVAIKLEKNLCGICIVGEESNKNITADHVEILKDISFNGEVMSLSKLGILTLVPSKNKIQTLRGLNSRLFLKEIDEII